MRVKVLKEFKDKYTGQMHKKEEVLNINKERYEEIRKVNAGLVEEIKKSATKKAE